ncbi:MAG: glycosyltransferase [Deltaproteobacteria bacterium]|nr:glycosyltransferase [Deltaproteobacteria bacterium]
MDKLTVVIPTYNRAQYLKKAIQGVLEQSFKDFRLIILDNNSSDNTATIVKSFDDARIHYIKNEKNIGSIENLNKAIELCETEYLSIPHDDDIMKKEFLERELQILESNQNISVVATNAEIIDENGNVIGNKLLNYNNDRVFATHEYSRNSLLGSDISFFLPCPTVMFRTNILKKYKLRFKEEMMLMADAFLWLELNTLPFEFYWVADPLYMYRFHCGQESKQSFIISRINFFDKLKPFLIKNDLANLIPAVAHGYYLFITNNLIEETLFHGLTNEQYKIYKDKMNAAGITMQYKIGCKEIKLYFKILLMKISPNILRTILRLKRKELK